jgi:hypothetical protein
MDVRMEQNFSETDDYSTSQEIQPAFQKKILFLVWSKALTLTLYLDSLILCKLLHVLYLVPFLMLL